MVARPPYPENNSGQICPPTAADLAAEMDRLDAMYAAFDERIAEALTPEPVDWDRHYRELFAEIAEAGRQRAARMEGGA